MSPCLSISLHLRRALTAPDDLAGPAVCPRCRQRCSLGRRRGGRDGAPAANVEKPAELRRRPHPRAIDPADPPARLQDAQPQLVRAGLLAIPLAWCRCCCRRLLPRAGGAAVNAYAAAQAETHPQGRPAMSARTANSCPAATCPGARPDADGNAIACVAAGGAFLHRRTATGRRRPSSRRRFRAPRG